MAKSELARRLLNIVDESAGKTQQEFVDSLNPIIVQVEVDEHYNTKDRLKIFDQMSRLTNCDVHQRRKYAKKTAKYL